MISVTYRIEPITAALVAEEKSVETMNAKQTVEHPKEPKKTNSTSKSQFENIVAQQISATPADTRRNCAAQQNTRHSK